MSLIECIPNISEGRRPDVLDACAKAIRSTGVHLLDVKPDASHNRTVYTFAGSPDGVKAAALALFAEALSAIDLRTHSGEHPRVGAVDVVPFVPLEGATMAECVALAKTVGAEVARRFGVPVFLYEEAAATPARTGEIVGLRLRPDATSNTDRRSGRAVMSALHEGAGHG